MEGKKPTSPVVYLGTRAVDLSNRFLMVAKIIAFLCLIAVGFQFVEFKQLEYTNIKYSMVALPILIVSFGFQNMIPTLSHYLGGDTKRTKQAIIAGSLFTLTIYLLWEIIALGSLPIEGQSGIFQSYQIGIDAAAALKNYIASPWLDSFAALLAFFAFHLLPDTQTDASEDNAHDKSLIQAVHQK